MNLLLLSGYCFRCRTVGVLNSCSRGILQRLGNKATSRSTCATSALATQRSFASTTHDAKNLDGDNFSVIYRFPHIVFVRTLARLKLFQTGAVVIFIPASALLSSMQYLDPQAPYLVSSIGIFACAMLYVMSELTRRAVGAMYIDPERQFLKVSHLTFWGSRKNIIVPVDDIMPFSDTSELPSNVYVKLMRYSTKNVLYFSIKYGRIFDKDAFEFVFGKLNRV